MTGVARGVGETPAELAVALDQHKARRRRTAAQQMQRQQRAAENPPPRLRSLSCSGSPLLT
jgi:hypothetical protein